MNELEQRIHAEIAEKGPIPFSRFMERALYEPDLGYYETQREVGRSGDFYTSVSVGSLMGNCWRSSLPIGCRISRGPCSWSKSERMMADWPGTCWHICEIGGRNYMSAVS